MLPCTEPCHKALNNYRSEMKKCGAQIFTKGKVLPELAAVEPWFCQALWAPCGMNASHLLTTLLERWMGSRRLKMQFVILRMPGRLGPSPNIMSP